MPAQLFDANPHQFPPVGSVAPMPAGSEFWRGVGKTWLSFLSARKQRKNETIASRDSKSASQQLSLS